MPLFLLSLQCFRRGLPSVLLAALFVRDGLLRLCIPRLRAFETPLVELLGIRPFDA